MTIFQSCYFFGTATFFRAATSSQQLFFGSKLLPSGYLLKIDNFLGQVLFLEDELVQNKDIYNRATFPKQVLLYSQNQFFFANSYFFSKADSSEKKPFKKSYFFREAAFRKQLLFQKSNITQLAFSEKVLLHSYKLPFHSYTLLWLVTYGDSVWVLSCVTIYSQTSSHNRYLTRYLFAIVWLISRLHELLWNDYFFRASYFYRQFFFHKSHFFTVSYYFWTSIFSQLRFLFIS